MMPVRLSRGNKLTARISFDTSNSIAGGWFALIRALAELSGQENLDAYLLDLVLDFFNAVDVAIFVLKDAFENLAGGKSATSPACLIALL
jgi:hypothetical protein